MSGTSGKPRILFINHWAKALGGAELSLLDILADMDNRAEIVLLTSETGLLAERIRNKQIVHKVIPCPPDTLQIKRDHLVFSLLYHWRATTGFLLFVTKVFLFTRQIRPHCIHANVPKSHITLLLLTLLGFRGRGILHMREIFTSGSFAFNLYRLLFRASGLRVIAISDAVKRALPGRIQKSTVVLYNGVEIPVYHNRHSITLPIRFLFMGRIVPWKGCHRLIAAFSELQKEIPSGSATLRLVGATSYWNESYRNRLEELIKELNVGSAVTIEGMTDTPYEVFSCHHVLCLPSEKEPFGRVAVEAQGNGLPVIGFADGGLPEIIVNQKTGLLVPKDDYRGFVSAMAYFVNNPTSIAVFGKNGHIRAKRHFNRELQVPAITAFLMAQMKHGADSDGSAL